jgi:hypothetical protein
MFAQVFGQCTKDIECKGDRICVNGKCVNPSQAIPASTVSIFMEAASKEKASEFPIYLTAIYTGELAYQAETGKYFKIMAKLGDSTGVNLSDSQWFSYSLTDTTDSTFTAHAHAKAHFGKVNIGDEATINQKNEKHCTPALKRYCPSWK